MRIISLNCWDDRTGKIAAYLAGAGADVLYLQEMASSATLCIDRGHFRLNTKFFPELQKALPDYLGYFFPVTHYYYESREIRPGDDLLLGNAVFVRNEYPVLELVSRFIHREFQHLPYGEKAFSTRAEAFCVKAPSWDKSLVVAGMHGLWDAAGKGDTEERWHQTAAFLGLLEDMQAGMPRPAVVCGDFNLLPDSTFFKELAARGFTDLVTAHGHTSTRTSYYADNPEKKGRPMFADYMLVNDRVTVKNFEVVREPEVSDHCPLLLDLEVE